MFRNVPPHRFRFQRELYAVALVLVQVAVLVLLLALVLERDNDETYEDVNHEERDNDYVDDVVGGHDRPEVVDRSAVLLVRVYADVEQVGPTLKGWDGEQSQHCFWYVVKVEAVQVPEALLLHRLSVLPHQVGAAGMEKSPS